MFVSRCNRKGKQLLLSRRIIKIYHRSIEPRDIVVGEMKTELNVSIDRKKERERKNEIEENLSLIFLSSSFNHPRWYVLAFFNPPSPLITTCWEMEEVVFPRVETRRVFRSNIFPRHDDKPVRRFVSSHAISREIKNSINATVLFQTLSSPIFFLPLSSFSLLPWFLRKN